MDYKSARLIGASGALNKNKGVMLVGASSSCTLKLRGISGGAWLDQTMGLTLTAQESFRIVPTQVYGVTLGSGTLFELN
jgi:hypothetical protein